jgi:hypothetical protein
MLVFSGSTTAYGMYFNSKEKNIEQQESHKKNSDEPMCPRRKAVPAPHVAPVVLFLLEILHQPIKAYV